MPAAIEIESGREGEGGKEGDRGEVRGIGGGAAIVQQVALMGSLAAVAFAVCICNCFHLPQLCIFRSLSLFLSLALSFPFFLPHSLFICFIV